VTRVNVNCTSGPPYAPFATSFSQVEGAQLYNGSGNDSVTLGPSSQVSAAVQQPRVPVTFFSGTFLDSSPTVISTLDGNDLVEIWGQVGSPSTGTATDIDLGNGDDIFRVGGAFISTAIPPTQSPGGEIALAVVVPEPQIYPGGQVFGSVRGGAGNDTLEVNARGSVEFGIDAGDGDDGVSLLGGVVGSTQTAGNVVLGNGNDSFLISGFSGVDEPSEGSPGGPFTEAAILYGTVSGGEGNDQFTVEVGGTVLGRGTAIAVDGGAGNDIVDIIGGTIGDPAAQANVALGDGNDKFTIKGGTGDNGQGPIIDGILHGSILGDAGDDSVGIEVNGVVSGNVSGGTGNDTIAVSGGTVAGNVTGDDGNDQLAVSGGAVAGNLTGGAGVDSVTVSGGFVGGNVEGETITLTGGTIGGDISGVSGDTLTINGSPTALNLRNGVVISGTNAVGVITNEDLGQGGTQTQFFTGFNSVALSNSTIGFGTGSNGIGQLSLTNGSTLFVRGNSTLSGSLNVSGSTINMIDGAADDVLTLGGLVINNGQIAIDLNQQTLLADRLVANSFSSIGANTIFVNLLGTPQFAGATDIPVILTNAPLTPGTFTVVGVPGTPASLFTFEVVAGANGSLFIRASPANFGVALATANAADVGIIDTAVDALYGINNDALDADLGLSGGSPLVQLSDTFGVFASGQLAHVEHDGFTITNNNLVGIGPAFDADDFSAAISFDFNAAKHFGFEERYGLNIGVFAGYASTDVGLGTFQGFSRVGDADNSSGMFGAYGLFRERQNYVLVSVSGFLGETDITNDVLGTTGNYDTQGVVVTGSVGHIFNLTDRLRFDLRGGLLGVDFDGGDYVDSGGNQFGKSQISFGAFKFEPGIYADYQLDNGMVISPYARADLQQRFGYSNTAIIDTQEIEFDDADFSAALSAGFNLKMTQRSMMSGEIRGKVSDDSSTFGGKLGLKVAF